MLFDKSVFAIGLLNNINNFSKIASFLKIVIEGLSKTSIFKFSLPVIIRSKEGTAIELIIFNKFIIVKYECFSLNILKQDFELSIIIDIE